MTRSLFRNFSRRGVEYLLISGQASVLYGAATFSEDIDLWVRPAPANIRRFLRALSDCSAKVYKLTPPLELSYFRRGHGFHFLLPSPSGPVYLDVMGRPPRVPGFSSALRRSEVMPTPWGPVPTVSIEDLVQLKKTRRLQDYDIISNLVAIRLGRTPSPDRRLWRWAYEETCRAEDRLELASRLGIRTTLGDSRRRIARRILRLQRADAAYWQPIVRELRELRNRGHLIPEGMPVRRLLHDR